MSDDIQDSVMDLELAEKQCNNCEEVKPLSEFYKQRGAPDGHQYVCAECTKIRVAEYRERKRKEMGDEAYAEWRNSIVAKHRATPAGRKKAQLHTKAMRLAEADLKELHPKQYRALLDKHRYELGLME